MSNRSSASSRPSINVLDGFRRAWRATSEDELPLHHSPKSVSQQYAMTHLDRDRLGGRERKALDSQEYQNVPHEKRNAEQFGRQTKKIFHFPRTKDPRVLFKPRRNQRPVLTDTNETARLDTHDPQIWRGIGHIHSNSDSEDNARKKTQNKEETGKFRDVIEEDIYRRLRAEQWGDRKRNQEEKGTISGRGDQRPHRQSSSQNRRRFPRLAKTDHKTSVHHDPNVQCSSSYAKLLLQSNYVDSNENELSQGHQDMEDTADLINKVSGKMIEHRRKTRKQRFSH